MLTFCSGQPRTRELWWRGIAPKSRAEVWERAIGNDLALTIATYNRALQRSQDVEAQIARGGKHEQCKERAWFDAIRRDIRATLPELKMFQPGYPLHDHLTNLLMAYCMYRSDVGYSHGTHVSLPCCAHYQPTTGTSPSQSSTSLTHFAAPCRNPRT